MAKTTELLTDADCRNALCPPELKRRRLSDGGSLYLEVSPSGSKRWFFKFYPDGKESRLALGSYPSVSLKEARKARDKARQARQPPWREPCAGSQGRKDRQEDRERDDL